jgi:hypothetical protein
MTASSITGDKLSLPALRFRLDQTMKLHDTLIEEMVQLRALIDAFETPRVKLEPADSDADEIDKLDDPNVGDDL